MTNKYIKSFFTFLIHVSRRFSNYCVMKYMNVMNLSEDSFLDFRDFMHAIEQLESINPDNRESVENSINSLTVLCKVTEVELSSACEPLSYSYNQAKAWGYSHKKTVRDKDGWVHILEHLDGRRLACNATDSFNLTHD